MMFRKIVNAFRSLPVHIQRYLRLAAGWLCIGFGLIGLVLPLLPGIPFLLLGSWLLGWDGWLRPWLAKWFPFAQNRHLRTTGTPGGS